MGTRIFPHIPATPLKPKALLMRSNRGWCPLHSLSFSLEHDLFMLQNEPASPFFSYSCPVFPIFLPSPSHTKTFCHGVTDMHLCRILTEHQHTTNLVQLSIINIWSLCGDSLILAGLGLVSIPSAPVSLQPTKIKSDRKDHQPKEFTDYFEE